MGHGNIYILGMTKSYLDENIHFEARSPGRCC